MSERNDMPATTEPETIRLANLLQDEAGVDGYVHDEAAAALRRLHAQSLADEALMREAIREQLAIIRDVEQHIDQGAQSELKAAADQPGYGTGVFVHVDRQMKKMRAALSKLSQRLGE